MSSPEYRDMLRMRVHEALYGDGQNSGGITSTILSGAPKEYAIYRDLTGQCRAYHNVLKLMDEVWHELYDPKPIEQPKPAGVGVET